MRARADCYDKLARWQFRDGSLRDTLGDLHAFMPDHEPVFGTDGLVFPSPATHAILRLLKAGERVFQTLY